MAMNTPNRRAAICAIAALPVALAAAPAVGAVRTQPTTAIQAAFAEWKAAWATYNAVPIEDETPDGERAFWVRVDALEATIRDTPADRPCDVAAKLWVALAHSSLGHSHREDIATTADADALRHIESEFDYDQRLVASALLALEAAGGWA